VRIARLVLIVVNWHLLLVPNFWTCKNGTVGTSLAPLARRWHHWQVVGTFFFFPDVVPCFLIIANLIVV
jgi:hypothetical protein